MLLKQSLKFFLGCVASTLRLRLSLSLGLSLSERVKLIARRNFHDCATDIALATSIKKGNQLIAYRSIFRSRGPR